jgi:aspartate aminotransferase
LTIAATIAYFGAVSAPAKPVVSEHFRRREPSDIRKAQIEFSKRGEQVEEINLAIGNVSLPMHPAMLRRLSGLREAESPFRDGVLQYTPTVGLEETRQAFLNIIASCGFRTRGLQVLVTEGGSQAMELILLGVCGPAGSGKRPLLVIDPTYTNYGLFAERTGRSTVALTRALGTDGRFALPKASQIESLIRKHNPGGLLVIPYDNPTGQLYSREQLLELASLCVKYNLWMASDEAYRELYYAEGRAVSIWGISDEEVPGIEGRRLGLESASKMWNACGLRIGALVTDNEEFHQKAVAENTASLCPNAIGQYIFGALAHEGPAELQAWYERQREYYRSLLARLTGELARSLPGLIVSSPDAAIYSVLDVRDIVKPGFDAREFVMYCARRGAVELEGRRYTLLVAPMAGFYSVGREPNPGLTQMRIAYVEPPETLRKVPILFRELLARYEAQR